MDRTVDKRFRFPHVACRSIWHGRWASRGECTLVSDTSIVADSDGPHHVLGFWSVAPPKLRHESRMRGDSMSFIVV
ncbi:hypothetical protein GW17_00001056 [Ensete ventricosum]|nr:hypothetical protein GW17_00001056 [Ensete ventricosum]